MPTMIVLINLKEDVAPDEYERWQEERYVPAVLCLASVDEWRGYRMSGLPESYGSPTSTSFRSRQTIRNSSPGV